MFLRFLTLALAALLMGMSLAHSLEMPQKMAIDGPLWLTMQHTLYRYFAIVGAPIEIGTILTCAVLAYLERRNRPALYLTAAALVCFAVAFFVVWLGYTNAVNAKTAQWTMESIPGDWTHWRAQWEYSHAIRFVLQFTGFSLLLASVLADASKVQKPA